jgi:hypothetical protein
MEMKSVKINHVPLRPAHHPMQNTSKVQQARNCPHHYLQCCNPNPILFHRALSCSTLPQIVSKLEHRGNIATDFDS